MEWDCNPSCCSILQVKLGRALKKNLRMFLFKPFFCIVHFWETPILRAGLNDWKKLIFFFFCPLEDKRGWGQSLGYIKYLLTDPYRYVLVVSEKF